jgi:hypothetical protein
MHKKDIRGFTSSVAENNISGDLTKGGHLGSTSLLIQSDKELKEEKFFHSRNIQSQATIEPLNNGAGTYSLLMPSSTIQATGQL